MSKRNPHKPEPPVDDLPNYWDRFADDRTETYHALRDVWTRMPDQAKRIFGSYGLPARSANFGRYACQQDSLQHGKDWDALRVVFAVALMHFYGYVPDTPSAKGGFRWKKAGA